MDNTNFDLNLIKTFVSVYETGSTTLASEKLFVSQPAITQSIKKLEETFNCELFVRLPKGMKPTPSGEVLYEDFKRALNSVQHGVNVLFERNQIEGGEIVIGSSSTIMRGLLLPLIFKFREKHPNIKISIVDGISTQLMEKLKRGDVDMAIVSEPAQSIEGANKKVITTIEDCFVVNKNFESDFVSKNELKNYQMILQKLPSSNRVFFDKLCKENKVTIVPSLETESFGIILDFVSNATDMIGFSTKSFIEKDLKTKKIKILKTDFEITPREICVFNMKDRIMANSSRMFLSELETYFASVKE